MKGKTISQVRVEFAHEGSRTIVKKKQQKKLRFLDLNWKVWKWILWNKLLIFEKKNSMTDKY